MPTNEYSPSISIYYPYILIFLFFMIGAFIGSAFYCKLMRKINGEKWSKGRSKCQSCQKTLGVMELIPIFSYLFQGGKCKKCKAKIGIKSFLAEIIMGSAMAFAAIISLFSQFVNLPIYIIFIIYILMGIMSINDMETSEAEYYMTIPILVIGFINSFKYGFLGIISILIITIVLIGLDCYKGGSIGGADIIVAAGLTGLIPPIHCGYVLLIPAIIGIAIYLVETKFFKKETFSENKGIKFLPSLMVGFFIIQLLEVLEGVF